MDDSVPHYDTASFLPNDFFSKDVNEPFIQKMMAAVMPGSTWVKGDPNKFEPDYFCNAAPFEFTLASDSKRKNNFIQRFRCGTFCSDDAAKDLFGFIEDRIADKASKNYAVTNVNLCVLCLLDMTDWVLDEYGSVTHSDTDHPRQQFFSRLKETYISTDVFDNIFLIIPDVCAKWWVFNVLADSRTAVSLTDENIRSGQYPYIMLKSVYDDFVEKEGATP